jgi:hypothetical protein
VFPERKREGRAWGSALLAFVDLLFNPEAVAGHGKAEDEIDQGDEQIALDLERPPVGV